MNKAKIRIVFCYFLLVMFFIFLPILKILFRIKFCEKFLKKIFLPLNKFLTGSNRLCKTCNDHLDIDTSLKGWFNRQCYICSWVYYENNNNKGEK